MPPDCCEILGLSAGLCGPADVRAHFLRRRRELVERLHCPKDGPAARESLDELHLAYRHYSLNRGAKPARAGPSDAADAMRSLIRTSLEDGLLRHSRRQMLLAEGRKRGLTHFQTQLLIASTMIETDGPPRAVRSPRIETDADRHSAAEINDTRRAVARFAAAALLALALLLTALREIG